MSHPTTRRMFVQTLGLTAVSLLAAACGPLRATSPEAVPPAPQTASAPTPSVAGPLLSSGAPTPTPADAPRAGVPTRVTRSRMTTQRSAVEIRGDARCRNRSQSILGVNVTRQIKLRLRGTGWPFPIHAPIEAMLHGVEARRTGNQRDLIKIPIGGDLDGGDLVLTVLQHESTSCEARRAKKRLAPI